MASRTSAETAKMRSRRSWKAQRFAQIETMTLSPSQLAAFQRATADFGADHTEALETVRKLARVPANRYFSIRPTGEVIVDTTRTREVTAKKISKSDQ